MDYEELYSILPKSHGLWTVQDTQQWLTFIGLHSLKKNFQQSSVDGSILNCLTQEDLVKELGITSKIIVKKITNWIVNGLPAFDNYVLDRQGDNRVKMQTYKINSSLKSLSNLKNGEKKEEIKEEIKKPRQILLTESSKKTENNQFIIKNLQYYSGGSYDLTERSATIGRHASNDIIILDQFISRHHAQIIYEKQKYYLRDCGSNSGTFIKILQKMELKSGMIIEMGSNQFEINIDSNNVCTVLVVDGPNTEYYKELTDFEFYSFGRKDSNYVSFPDDQHLSGIHSKIFMMKGRWYIQDIATTNGTWLRLSKQGQQSDVFLLEDKCQFKMSSNLIYECILNTNNRKTHKVVEEKCCFCRTEEKDAMIYPCKHTIGCYQCLKTKTECPNCETPITEIIKIFTA